MNDTRSYESWRMLRLCPRRPEDDLFVGDQAGQAHRVHVHARRALAAPRPRAARGRSSGRAAGARSPPPAGPARWPGRVQRGARGGVALGVVVQLDDLDAVHERRGQLAEAHQQHRAHGEVGRHDGVGAPAHRTASLRRGSGRRPEPGGADHGVDAVRRRSGARCARTASATVKSTTTSVPTVGEGVDLARRWCGPQASRPTWPGSTAATSSMSGRRRDGPAHLWPMRPPAPTTPTLNIAVSATGRPVRRRWESNSSASNGPDRAQRCAGPKPADRPPSQHLVAGHRLDPLEHLVDAEHLAVKQQRRADAAHAGARVLSREQHLGPQVALGDGQLALGDPRLRPAASSSAVDDARAPRARARVPCRPTTASEPASA